MAQNVLFEELLVVLLENEVSFEFLLEDRLNEEDPNLFYANNCLSYPCIILDNGIEEFAESFWLLWKRNHDLVIFADFGPYLASKVSSHLLIAWVSHISGAVIEHLAIEAVDRITFWECFVNQEVVIIGVSPLESFLGDHLELLELLNKPVLDAMHELLNTFLENVKQDIWCYLEAPLFEPLGKPE